MPRLMSVSLTEQAVLDRRKTDRLTVGRLREVLDYDPETGLLTWTGAPTLTGRRRKNKGVVAGVRAPNGYIKVGIDGVKYQAHRLAWLHQHGRWPTQLVDHVNGDPGDNRLANLREANTSENAQNLRTPHADNAAQLLGVTARSGGRYQAAIMVSGVRRHLGSFGSAEAAHAAYLKAKADLHPFGGLTCHG